MALLLENVAIKGGQVLDLYTRPCGLHVLRGATDPSIIEVQIDLKGYVSRDAMLAGESAVKPKAIQMRLGFRNVPAKMDLEGEEIRPAVVQVPPAIVQWVKDGLALMYPALIKAQAELADATDILD